MASRSSGIPATPVYLVKSVLMALMAASLICRGVLKCGSPAPKSASSIPCAFSLAASFTMARVAEISMRLMRSLTNFCVVVVVADIWPPLVFRLLAVHLLMQTLLYDLRHQRAHGAAQLEDLFHQTRTEV